MTKDKVNDAGNTKPSRKHATESPSNTRKSERIEKQTSPSPSPIKKKPERIEKPMGPSPLRRSDRSKKHFSPDSSGSKNVVEVPASINIKSTEEKIASSSKQTAGDVGKDKKNDRQDSYVGDKKRKRTTAREYKALFKPQRIRIIEADDDKDPEGPSSNKCTASNHKKGMFDVDKELRRPDKLPQLDNNKNGCSLEDGDDGCKKQNYDETCLACSKEQRINHDLDNQQEPDCEKTCNRDLCGTSSLKVRETCKAGGVMGKAENDDAATPLIKDTSSYHDRESYGSICVSCKLGGQLRFCDAVGCDRCYHVSCLDPPVENLSLGNWHCPVCVNNTNSSVHPASRVAESIWDSREVELSGAKGPLLVEKFNKDPVNYNSISKFVEFWVPVPISNVQLEQYCRTILSNAMALRSCKKNDTVGFTHDILISNRKCCNHPYIVDNELQGKITKGLEPAMIWDVGIKASGKLQFLDSILPEIKNRQLRVVILFQPTGGSGRGVASVGDILDDFVLQRFGQDSYERVDGIGIVPAKKQAALNNFNTNMSRFIFLLEHRGCLPNIKLSSVDIIVIFDSDFNPANDLRALQKISIDAKSEQIKIFRLYSSCTLEEKILRLAEDNLAIDSKLQRGTCDTLLMWGASDLFNKLSEFHSSSSVDIFSQEPFLNDVVEEFIDLISHKGKSKDTVKSIITRVQSYGNYGKRSLPLLSETKTQLLPDGEQPHVFWRNLLEGWYPQWKFVSMSTPRQRKRPNLFLYSSKESPFADSNVAKKRKKTPNNNTERPADSSKHLTQGGIGGTNEGTSGVPSHNESQSSSGDHFWSTTVHNETEFHDSLKFTVSELCKVLNFSEDAKIIVENFLKFVLENYQVSKEHESALQAFMISLCWIGSSLLKFKIDWKESFALAKKHLNFSCMEEEANSAYLKLEPAKETFLRHIENQEKCDALNDCIPAPQVTSTESTEPRISHSLPLNPQGVNVQPTLVRKELKEIEKFKREWEEKRVHLEKDYHVDKALIRILHSNLSIRSEKIKALDNEFAKKLEEHERMKEVHLKDFKAMMAVNQDSSLHGSQHETQRVDSGNSKQGAQDNPEAAVSSLPIEEFPAQQYDGADNNVAGRHAAVSRVPSEEIPAQQHDGIDDNVAGPIDSIELGVLEADVNWENVKGGTSSPDRSRAVEDRNKTGPGDMVRHVESAEMGMPAGNCDEETAEDGTVIPDTPLAVEDQNDSCGSSSSNSPCTAGSQEKMHSVPLDASPASDHTIPTIQAIQNELLQLPHGRMQDNARQTNPGSLPEIDIDNLHARQGQSGQITSEDSSLVPHDESPFQLSTNPPIFENQSDMLPAGGLLLETTCKEPDNTCIPSGTIQSVENNDNASDQTMLQSGRNLEERPLAAAESSLGEHAPHLPSSDAVHDQPHVELHNPVQNPEASVPPLTVEISNQNTSPCTVGSQVKMHPVQLFASPASDHSTPTIPEIQNEPLQLPHGRMQDKGGQADPGSLPGVDIDNLHPVDAGQAGQINAEDSSLVSHDESPLQLSTNPSIFENQSDILPVGGLLLGTTCEEPNLACFPGGPSQSVQNDDNPSDQTILQSGSNLEERPVLAAETSLGEHAPPLPSSEAVHDQPRVELHNSAQNPEASVPPFTVEISNQNTSRHELNFAHPLQAEMERLCAAKDHAIRSHEDTKQRLKSECEKEIAEMITQINLKYEAKFQEAEVALHLKKKELDMNLNRVVMNKILAEAFRSKCHDITPGHAEQVSQAGLMQQLHRFSGPPSMRRSFGNASSSPGQSSGSQQTTPPPQPPPLQIVHQPAALFSSTQSRVSPNTNLRPPPNVNSITMSAANLRINMETSAHAPHMRHSGGSEIRSPAPHMRHSGGSEIRAPAPHMRLSGGSEMRAPAPHMRPSGGSEIRAPAPHMRPFRSPASGSPEFATYQSRRVQPTPQVTSSLPLTSPSNSQAMSSLPTFSPQAPPQSTVVPPLLAHNPALGSRQHPPSSLTATTSSHAPLPRSTSLPTYQTAVFRPEGGGSPFPSTDAAHWHRHDTMQPLSEIGTMIDSLDLTDFILEDSASPSARASVASSSVHDLVCLSDDD